MKQKKKDARNDVWKKTIAKMHRDFQSRYEIEDELDKLRRRSELESEKTYWGYFSQIAKSSNIDMTSIYKDARRRHETQKRLISKKIDKFKEKVEARGIEEVRYRNQVRKAYLKDFREYYKKKEGNPEIKFAVIDPSTAWNYVTPSEGCTVVALPPCKDSEDFDWGSHEASGEIRPRGIHGADFINRIHIENGDCNVTNHAVIRQVVHFPGELAPTPEDNFEVTSVRLNMTLIGMHHGYRMEYGHPFGGTHFFDERSARVSISVYVAQYLFDHELPDHQWTALNDWPIYEARGEIFNPIFQDPASVPHNCSFVIRGRRNGGSYIMLTAELITEGWAVGQGACCLLLFGRGETFEVDRKIHLENITLIGHYC